MFYNAAQLAKSPWFRLATVALVATAAVVLVVTGDAWRTTAQSGSSSGFPVKTCPGGALSGRTSDLVEVIERFRSKDCADIVPADYETLTGLTFWRNGWTQIRPGDFDGFTALSSLRLKYNYITSVPKDAFRGLGALQTLDLSYNEIDTIHPEAFAPLTSLETLIIEYNDLTTLPAGVFNGLTSLETIRLQFNNIRSLPDNVFQGLPALRVLNLEDNYLSSDSLGFLTTHIPSLTHVYLASNLITSDGDGPDVDLPANIFSVHSGLMLIRLRTNAIKELPPGIFAGLTSLTDIDVSSNRLTELPAGMFAGLTSLRTLRVADNQIARVDESILNGLVGLRTINLLGNQIEQLPAGLFSGPRAYADTLTTVGFSDHLHIRLYENRLTELPPGIFTGLKHLRTLDLHTNRIADIPTGTFAGLESLYDLDLSENRISTLQADMLSGLTSLYRVRLNDNMLASVPATLFSGISSLCNIHLDDNQLTSLPVGLFSDARTSSWCSVWLHNNPLSASEVTRLTALLGTRGRFTLPASLASEDRVIPADADTPEDLAVCGTGPLNGRTRRIAQSIMSRIPSAVRTPLTGQPTDNPAKCSAITTEHLKLVTALTLPAVTSFQADDFADLPNLEYMATSDFNFVRVTTLPAGLFDGLTKLYELNFTSSFLKSLPRGIFDDLTNLRLLDLRYNLLTSLPNGIFRNLVNLRELYLQQNLLTSLPTGGFRSLRELRTLTLHLNELEQDDFPVGTFSGLRNLRSIDLRLNQFEWLYVERFAGLDMLKNLHIAALTELASSMELAQFRTLLPNLNFLTFRPGSQVFELPATPTPVPTATPTLNERIGLPIVSKIEPIARTLVVTAGTEIRLSVALYDVQDYRDDELAKQNPMRIEWNGPEGGSFSDAGTDDGTAARVVIWRAPTLPGQHAVTARVMPAWACDGEAHECTATFNVRIVRGAGTPTPEPTPCPTTGIVPSSLTDDDGAAYTTITPAEGGEFVGEGVSVSVPRGALSGCRHVGLRGYELQDALSMTYAGWTAAGSRYRVDVVNVSGTKLTNLVMQEPASVCVPLPAQLRSTLTGITLLRDDGSGNAVSLTSGVRSHAAEGYRLCGNVSQLPAVVVAAGPGVGTGAQMPSPTPEAGTPETGGGSPTGAYVLLALVLGALAVLGAMRLLDAGQRARR